MLDSTSTTAARTGKTPLAVWIKTARPFTLTAAISPVLVGTAIAVLQHALNIGLFLATLVSCLFLQIGANFFNEYFDYRYGLDHAGSLGASTVIFTNELTERQVLGGGIVAFGIAAALGVILIALIGPAILLFGLGGMAIAYFYSARPFKFATRGLGDVLVFLAMGVLMTWGAYYVQIHQWSWQAIAASVPIGLLVTAIMNMNNTRDYQDDLAVAKKTLPVRFGRIFGQRFHAFLLVGSYVAVTIFVLAHVLPFLTLAVWITFPTAWLNVQAVLRGGNDKLVYLRAIKATAQLHLRFGVLLAVALVAASFSHIG